jgi:UDP-N-acetylmuramate dehydrogenase
MTDLLADCTTLRFGGPAAQLLTHAEPGNWNAITRTARRHRLPPLVIGGGSNLIAPDHGYPGPVIRITTRGIRPRAARDHVDLTVQAGEPLDDLVGYAAAYHLTGIEYLAGIPGTAGAAPIQNTGAYGQQISDTLISVTAYDWRTDATAELPAAACQLTYRNSIFKTTGQWTILALTIRLRRSARAAPVTYQPLADALGMPLGTQPTLTDAVTAVRADRTARGLSLPRTGPDTRQAGSVFTNPLVTERQAALIKANGGTVHTSPQGQHRASAGWLLQHTGYSPGHKISDGVHCSAKRTLTIVARDLATSASYTRALRTLISQVHETTGIQLAIEPLIVQGPLPGGDVTARSEQRQLGRLDVAGGTDPACESSQRGQSR